jgi:peptide/nickel transport system substrate-binding protein
VGTRRSAVLGIALLAAVVAALVAVLSGGSPTAVAPTTKPPTALTGAGENLYDGRRGGTLTVYDSEDFQSLDPGQSYSLLDYEVMYATQMPLYEYPPNNPTVPSPMLAAGPAIVSDHGRTVTVHIKPDVHFSPPVNRAVTSADVAYAIERGANPNVANPYFQPYFGDLVGASKANGGPIAGIRTPNRTTIVFQLTAPTADLLIGALTLPLSAPVPRSFAARLDAMKPTQYGSSYEVFTGPYMLESSPAGRFLGLGYRPGTSATLVRNPNWRRSTDPAPAYLNRINIKIGGSAEVIGRQVLLGSDAVQNDIPTNTNVALAYQRHYRQLVATPGAGDEYVSLNNARGVLTNVNVRRAVYAALDREAMVKLAGGAVVGQVGTHFITPGTAGFAQAGGYAGPQVPWNEHPSGDLALAESYMRHAGYPAGRYTGHQVIRIIGSSDSNGPAEASIVRDAFTALGFRVHAVDLDTSVMYEKYCGVPAAEVDACPSVGFARDFADPQTLLYTTFYGPSIAPSNNSNYGQVDDPAINAAMARAAHVVGAAARARAWAGVDRMLVEQAVAVPWIFDNQPHIRSADVRGINALWNGGSWDYAYTSLKHP